VLDMPESYAQGPPARRPYVHSRLALAWAAGLAAGLRGMDIGRSASRVRSSCGTIHCGWPVPEFVGVAVGPGGGDRIVLRVVLDPPAAFMQERTLVVLHPITGRGVSVQPRRP